MNRCHIRRGAVAMLLGTSLLVAAGPATAAEQETLIVYTSTSTEIFTVYQAAFEAAYPDIKLEMFHDSAGIVVARVMAERATPRADVLWDIPVTSLIVLQEEGLLEPYAPAEIGNIDPRMVDKNDPPYWFGYSGFATVACVNRIEAEALGLAHPASWEDLTRPEYRGQIVMPSPASSGTGFMLVAGFLDLMGEEEGWAFLDRLNENVAFYTHSGSKPCKLAGSGEHVIGLSLENAALRVLDSGAPLDIALPKEGLFWEIAGVSIVKGTDNLAAARRLLDWTATRSANALFAADWPIAAIPDMAQKLPAFPDDFTERLYDADFEWIAANRERIIEEWQQRYGSKAEAE